MPPIRRFRCVLGDLQPGRLQEGGAGDNSCGHGALGMTGGEQASLLLPNGIASAVPRIPCRCFVRVLVDGMYFVEPQGRLCGRLDFPDRDPFGP